MKSLTETLKEEFNAPPKNIDALVMDFFKNTDEIKDDVLHAFANKLNMSPHDLENVVYKLFKKLLKNEL